MFVLLQIQQSQKEKPQKTHRTYSIAERNATSKNVIKHTLHKWRVISQQLMWLLEPPKLGLLGFCPVADAQNVFCPVQRLGRAIEACFTGTSQSQS